MPPPDFLGGRAQYRDRQPEVVGDGSESDAGADRRGGDDVVSAGVPDPWQRVVFGADRDVRRTIADPGCDGRGQVERAEIDGEPGLTQRLGNPTGGAVLLEGEFRVSVDAVAQREQLGVAAAYPGGEGRPWSRASCKHSQRFG